MDLIGWFKPKQSMSPAKSTASTQGSSRKRKHDASPGRVHFQLSNGGDSSSGSSNSNEDNHADTIATTRETASAISGARPNKKPKLAGVSQYMVSQAKRGPKFSFDEVKSMIDNLLAQDRKKLETNVNVGIKNIDLGDFAVPGHKAESCKRLIDELVNHTRRVRTLEEVLQEIRANLNKRMYTDIISKASLDHIPRRPPSAYLLYHAERFKDLKDDFPLAADIAKIVAEEWKNLDDNTRAKYIQKHNEYIKAYRESMKNLGLGKVKKPLRPKSAKALFVQSELAKETTKRGTKFSQDKAKVARKKLEFEEKFEKLKQSEKDQWESICREEHERYDREKQEFIRLNPHLEVKEEKKRLKVRPPAAPKTPLKIYIEKKIPEGQEGQELKETEAKLKEKFPKLSKKKQIKYIKRAVKDNERFEAELEEFISEYPDFKLPQYPKSNLTKEQRRLYQSEVEHRPAPPAPTAYLHFCSKEIAALNDRDQAPTERLSAASTIWSNMSPSERAEADKSYLEYIKQYVVEMDAWLDKQDDKRIEQVSREEPKAMPDLWRKRIAKLERSQAKKSSQNQAQGKTKADSRSSVQADSSESSFSDSSS